MLRLNTRLWRVLVSYKRAVRECGSTPEVCSRQIPLDGYRTMKRLRVPHIICEVWEIADIILRSADCWKQ